MLKLAWAGIKAIVSAAQTDGVAISITVEAWEPGRSDPQRKTFWMWHGQVAAELSIRTGMRWTKDDVHEVVFLEKFMPRREVTDPETGEVKSRPIRTSETDSGVYDENGKKKPMKEVISESMTKYVAWCYENQIEVTIPEEGW